MRVGVILLLLSGLRPASLGPSSRRLGNLAAFSFALLLLLCGVGVVVVVVLACLLLYCFSFSLGYSFCTNTRSLDSFQHEALQLQQLLPAHAPISQSLPFLLFSRLHPASLSFFFCMSPPPSLLHLTLTTAVLHIHRFSDLSSVPDHLVLHLFQKTLAAGKLTDYVLRMFLATGNDEVLQLVKALRIRPVIKPILPTRCSDKEF